jgi:xanthine dehydrogenase YagR molybdenum-binding subunit
MDPKAVLEDAAVRIDETYRIPIEHHNSMELLATIAEWTGDKLTLHDKTQWVDNVRDQLSLVFGISVESVRVISPFVGGGFGSSLRPWAHPIVAAIAAMVVKRPVKLVLSRKQMFTSHGHRPYTIQRVALGATIQGKLIAIIHEGTAQTSFYEDYAENLLGPTRKLYASPNCFTKYRLVRGTIQTPTPMRAPGNASGVFALESAMDELAYKLNIDPLELRIRNYADVDPEDGLPWSSKGLLECYKRGASVFGWTRRNMEPRSNHDGHILVGMGIASGIYHTNRTKASARTRIFADGTAITQSASSDIGPGTWSMMQIICAEALGLPINQVRSQLGDSDLPAAPEQGGSITTASVGSAVYEASIAARAKILDLASRDRNSPLRGASDSQVIFENGRISWNNDPTRGETYEAILKRNNLDSVEAHVDSKPSEDSKNYSKSAFAAQFAEVHVDQALGTIRVTRFVSACAGGRIINQKTAHSQIVGGIVGGIGMALFLNEITKYLLAASYVSVFLPKSK